MSFILKVALGSYICMFFNNDSVEGRDGHTFFVILSLERWNKFILPLNLSWS